MALIKQILKNRASTQNHWFFVVLVFGLLGICGIASFILSMCLGEEIENNSIKWIFALASLLGSCAALIASIVAFLGLRAWKESLYVNKYLELIWKAQEKMRFLKSAYYLYKKSLEAVTEDTVDIENIQKTFSQEVEKARVYLNAVDAFESYEFSGFSELLDQLQANVDEFGGYNFDRRKRGMNSHFELINWFITEIQNLLHGQESEAINYKE